MNRMAHHKNVFACDGNGEGIEQTPDEENRPVAEKILIPTDGSNHAKKAIQWASDLVSGNGAVVYLMHVVPLKRLISPSGALWVPGESQSLIERMKQQGRQIVREAEEEARKRGIHTIKTVMAEGSPADEILYFVKKNKIDMVVMGNHGAGALERFFLGSVSDKVNHLAECICVTVK